MAQDRSAHLTTHSAGAPLAIQRVTPNEKGSIVVAFADAGAEPGGPLPDMYSAYQDNLSPALSWTGVPEAEAFALIVEDPDAPREKPFVHWMVWNIPGTAIGLPRGIGPRLPPGLEGAVQGLNDKGERGWFGPRPPEGHGVHRYHFQLFALDRRLPDDPRTSLDELTNMLKAHSLRCGEVVGTYERPERPQAAGEDRVNP